jgi:MtN3 and saliva related transmembrane protein
MDWIQFLGYLGSFLSSITFIPQVIRVYKTRSARDLSMYMLLIVFTSTLVWLAYGIGMKLWPVISCNGIICLLSAWLIWFKYSSERGGKGTT